MRLIARPDFDGIVCAALLQDVLPLDSRILWVEPAEIQKGNVAVFPGDVIANLPYHQNCSLWFDHHFTNKIDTPFEGAFEIAPSAARVVYNYYRSQFARDYSELIDQTDKIDTADLTMEEVLFPENHPYILLSMSLQGTASPDEAYCQQIISLLRSQPIDAIMQHPAVISKCRKVVAQNQLYKTLLIKHTQVCGHIAITDFRSLSPTPIGNRYLIYSLYPETIVHLKIRCDEKDQLRAIIGVGHSIFNRNCQVNVGLMLSQFEGGGHRGAGSCTFDARKIDDYLSQMIAILTKNEPNE